MTDQAPDTKVKRDLESMVLKYARSEKENLLHKGVIEDLNKKLDRVTKDNVQLANRVKLLTNDKTHLTDTLNAKLAQLTVLEQKNLQLNSIQETKFVEFQDRVNNLESCNEELLKQIESYKIKEGELLDFCERLSMKHMMLQSEFDEASRVAPNNEFELALKDNQNLLDQVKELQEEVESLQKSLEEEKKCSSELKIAKEKAELNLRNTSDQLQNEITLMKRKHKTVVKEMTRQLKQLHINSET